MGLLSRIEVAHSFSTPASREQVWRALEAAPRWPEVLSDLIEAHIEPHGLLEKGALLRTRARPGTPAADMSYRVVEVGSPRRLVLESEGEGQHFRARTEYALDAGGPGTRVTVTSRVVPVLLLHKLTTALRRQHYSDRFRESLVARTGALLVLAEQM